MPEDFETARGRVLATELLANTSDLKQIEIITQHIINVFGPNLGPDVSAEERYAKRNVTAATGNTFIVSADFLLNELNRRYPVPAKEREPETVPEPLRLIQEKADRLQDILTERKERALTPQTLGCGGLVTW